MQLHIMTVDLVNTYTCE